MCFVVYITAVVTAIMVGLMGNALVLLFVLRNKKKEKTVAGAFQANLAIADIAMSGMANPMCLLGKSIKCHLINVRILGSQGSVLSPLLFTFHITPPLA